MKCHLYPVDSIDQLAWPESSTGLSLDSPVRDLVETLKDNEHQHYLVVDRNNHRIRGVISASDLARKLRLDIRIHKGSSFIAIYQALFTTAPLH